MQKVSNTYKNYLENTLSLSPKSKIVVGETEYLGNVIMSTPKITHSNSSFIGGFPSKTCSFELYNPNNDIDLDNKELEVYKIVQTGEIKNLLNLEEYTFRGESNNSTIDFVSANKVVITSAENPTTWQNRAIVLDLPDGTYSFYVGKCSSTNSGVTDVWKNGGIAINKYVNGVRNTFVSLQAGKSTPFVIENGEGIEYTINFYLSFGTAITGINTVTYDELYMAKEDTFGGYVPYNTIEYIKQGVFIPQASNIINDITARKLKITNAQDRTQLLDGIYVSSLEWTTSHTGLEIVQEICTRNGVTLETTDFNFANYVFKTQPNFSSTITDREVISRIAQIGGEIAIFNNDGNIVIKSSTPTGHTITRKRYEKLSYEKPIIYNTIVLGMEGIDDTIIYPETIEGERIEYRIDDNPFTDLIREEIISTVASFIIGKSIIPFNVQNIVDGFYLELNDSITIIDKDNKSIEATILNYENASRIKSNLKAEITTSISDYNLAGSNKKTLNEVKLQVDHINNQIQSIVSKGYVNEDDLEVLRQSLVTQNEESITMTFTTLTEIMNSANAETQKQFQEQSKYIRFDGGVSLGEVGNEVTLRIENDTIYFSVSDVKIMEITPSGIKIEKVITEEIDMGDFALIVEEDGSLSLV